MTDPFEVRDPVDLAGLLLHARRSAGLTQRQAADRCDAVGQPDISAYERGLKVPGTVRLLMLLQVYGWRLQAAPDTSPSIVDS